jgi:hypothetical protein
MNGRFGSKADIGERPLLAQSGRKCGMSNFSALKLTCPDITTKAIAAPH